MAKIVDNYTLTEVIGQGQYGKVYRATHIDTKMNVAVKCIRVEKFREISKLTECTSNEIQTLMLIQDNINIVKFVEMIKTSNHIYLVYEFCEGGTLDAEMRKCGFFPEKRALLYFKQLMNAFKALSANNILHRDIKPDNILLKSGHLKLADFGFCKRMAGPDDLTQTVLGSPVYMAPEVLNGDLYNSKADIWSLGVVLFEMLFGYCPFNEGSMADFLKHIDNFKIQIPADRNPISNITEGLLRRMLEKDHFRRISWQDLFYQYEVTEYGVLTRREKGFEYDLMKLMKKNSYNQPQQKPQKQVSFKFNWEKIADGKSSVRSDELGEGQKHGDLDLIVGIKRKLKEFLAEHAKLLSASSTVGDILKKKYSKLAQVIAYYICSSVGSHLKELRKQAQEFRYANQQHLQSNPTESQEIRRLLGVLSEEEESILPQLNSLKLLLFSSQENRKLLANDPRLRRQNIEGYVQDLVETYPHLLSFEAYELDKAVSVHLLKVLIALNSSKEKESLSVNESMDKLRLVKLCHQRMRDLELL